MCGRSSPKEQLSGRRLSGLRGSWLLRRRIGWADSFNSVMNQVQTFWDKPNKRIKNIQKFKRKLSLTFIRFHPSCKFYRGQTPFSAYHGACPRIKQQTLFLETIRPSPPLAQAQRQTLPPRPPLSAVANFSEGQESMAEEHRC